MNDENKGAKASLRASKEYLESLGFC